MVAYTTLLTDDERYELTALRRMDGTYYGVYFAKDAEFCWNNEDYLRDVILPTLRKERNPWGLTDSIPIEDFEELREIFNLADKLGFFNT